MKLLKRVLITMILSLLFVSSSSAVNDRTIAGDSTRFSEGKGYPSNIQNAGYDARAKKLYLNFTLTSAGGGTPNFEYYVEVFDDTGNSLIDPGGGYTYNYDTPATAGPGASGEVQVNNHEVPLTDFPASYRVVVTVKDVT